MLKTQLADTDYSDNTSSAKKSIPFITLVFFLYIAGWVLQSTILFSWDNSALLHETQQLLSGGTYVNNFFEPNAPMILYLYIPPVLVAKMLSLSIIFIFRAYIFLLIFLSVWLCRLLGKKIFPHQNEIISNLFFLALLFAILILPIYEFGQREHIFLIFSLPYMLATTVRLENEKINTYIAILIGFLAGVGFAIKPFFMLTPILLELYVAISKRTLSMWLRPETLTLFIVLLTYTLVALNLHPDYFNTIIPYTMRLYYNGIAQPWQTIIFFPVSIFSYLAIVFYFIQYHVFNLLKNFTSVLCVSLISFFLIFISQRTIFYYHFLPLLSLTFLMNTLLFGLVISKQQNLKQSIALSIVAFINIAGLYLDLKVIWVSLLLYPLLFWGFIGSTSLIVFYLLQKEKKLAWCVLSSVIMLSIGYGFFYMALTDALISSHVFLETILFLLLLFTLAARNARFNKARVLIIITLAFSLFAGPFYICYVAYLASTFYKKNAAPLISYMKQHMQHRSIYFFSTGVRYIFPLIDYAQVDFVSRFPSLWMMPGLIKQKGLTQRDALFQQYSKDKKSLVDMISEDLNRKKPEFIFIETSKNKCYMLDSSQDFEYLQYFSDNKNFQQAWKAYHYLNTFSGSSIYGFADYQFAIYQRTL